MDGRVLVGRDRELAQLETLLVRVQAGEGALALIVGEPGIGKTRLANEITRRAATRGMRATWGHCWEGGGAPSLWPWREACDGLGVQFPEPISTGDPSEARFTMFRQAARALASTGPCVIVLEDLHAADRATLMMLELVATQLRTLPLLLIGTYRDLEASLLPDTSGALGRASRSGHVLQPARLGASDVAAVVRGEIADADDQAAARVFEATLGNPLFVTEMVRDLRSGSGSGTIPLGVREIIRQRLALISAEARRVLEIGAVHGVEFAAADVERIEPSAAAVLDHAARAGLVVARHDGWRFVHALYRESLYYELSRERRQELHREVARVLAARGVPSIELAHHLFEGGPGTASAGIEQAIRAARQAIAVFAFEDATVLLERARAAIPAGPDEKALQCTLMIARGEVRILSGDAAGRALCVEAAQLARELGNTELLARAGLAYGSVFLMGGVDPVLVGMLEEALAGLTGDTTLRARTMARLAAARQPSPPPDRPRDIELAFAAIELARRVAEPAELLEVLHAASGVMYGAVDPAIRIQISLEQERLAEQLGNMALLQYARTRIASDHLEMTNFAAHAELASAYERMVEVIGPAAGPWRAPLMRSMQAIAANDWPASERWQAEARRLDHGQPRARRAIAFHRICYLRATERHADLRAALPELRGLWLEMPYGNVIGEPRVASVLARLGDEDATRESLAKLPAAAFAEEINANSLADAVWLAGDAAQARIVRPLIRAERWQTYWFDCEITEAPGSRGAALMSAMIGDWDDCERMFARAVAEVDAVGIVGIAARMRFELGDLMIRLDRDLPRARSLLADARARAFAAGLHELVALIDRRNTVPVTSVVAPGTASQPARRVFSLVLEGEYYSVPTGSATLRFKASRGMQYLATLVEKPGVDIHVLELVGSSDADRGDSGEVIDATAVRDYRARLEALRDLVDEAEAIGDVDRAEHARDEMETIAAELSRGTGKGGRARRTESAVERARSAVQRRIKDALDRVAEQDAELGKWLRRAVRTGNYCSYRPDAD